MVENQESSLKKYEKKLRDCECTLFEVEKILKEEKIQRSKENDELNVSIG